MHAFQVPIWMRSSPGDITIDESQFQFSPVQCKPDLGDSDNHDNTMSNSECNFRRNENTQVFNTSNEMEGKVCHQIYMSQSRNAPVMPVHNRNALNLNAGCFNNGNYEDDDEIGQRYDGDPQQFLSESARIGDRFVRNNRPEQKRFIPVNSIEHNNGEKTVRYGHHRECNVTHNVHNDSVSTFEFDDQSVNTEYRTPNKFQTIQDVPLGSQVLKTKLNMDNNSFEVCNVEEGLNLSKKMSKFQPKHYQQFPANDAISQSVRNTNPHSICNDDDDVLASNATQSAVINSSAPYLFTNSNRNNVCIDSGAHGNDLPSRGPRMLGLKRSSFKAPRMAGSSGQSISAKTFQVPYNKYTANSVTGTSEVRNKPNHDQLMMAVFLWNHSDVQSHASLLQCLYSSAKI